MSIATSCPPSETLKQFLQGRLDRPVSEECESHVSQCDVCHETLVGLDANDTLNHYVAAALADRFDPTEDREAIQQLVERLASSSPERSMDRDSPSESAGQRQLLADRAAEVLCSLESSEDGLGRIGDYLLLELIGAGSSGVVFLALDETLNRNVAVKVLRPSLGLVARQRFLIEAQAAASIAHPNVVTIYHVGEAGRLAYLAMQWVPGKTLESLLAEQNVIDESLVASIALQIASGLAAAQQHKMIHRDIKPANIWVTRDEQAIRILDFGLARVADDDPGLTATGMLAGTPNYMSPEQTRGQDLDGRSDLFSLGCLMYRLLTGQLPFGHATVLGTLQAIQYQQPVPVQAIAPGVSDQLADLTMALLEKDPTQRPKSASQLVQMLSHARSDWPVPIRRYDVNSAVAGKMDLDAEAKPSAGQRRRFAGWRAIVAVGVLVALAAVGFAFQHQIILVVTNQGELVIETDDPDVRVEILKHGEQVKLIDEVTGQAIRIESGNYQIRATGDPSSGNEIRVTPAALTMTRGGKQVVRVTKRPLRRDGRDPSMRRGTSIGDMGRMSGAGASGSLGQSSDERADQFGAGGMSGGSSRSRSGWAGGFGGGNFGGGDSSGPSEFDGGAGAARRGAGMSGMGIGDNQESTALGLPGGSGGGKDRNSGGDFGNEFSGGGGIGASGGLGSGRPSSAGAGMGGGMGRGAGAGGMGMGDNQESTAPGLPGSSGGGTDTGSGSGFGNRRPSSAGGAGVGRGAGAGGMGMGDSQDSTAAGLSGGRSGGMGLGSGGGSEMGRGAGAGEATGKAGGYRPGGFNGMGSPDAGLGNNRENRGQRGSDGGKPRQTPRSQIPGRRRNGGQK